MTPLAHGIGSVRDLPVPASFFYTTAAIVLVVSFVALGALWKRPLLERHGGGRRLSGLLSTILLSAALRVGLQAVAVALLTLTLTAALFGTPVEIRNWAPTFVYVAFWVGIPVLSVALGNVWRVLSPWRALADAAVYALERAGREARPILPAPTRLGRYPAAGALFAFVALELAHPRPADPRTLAVAIAIYTYWALAGMALYGRDAWERQGEGFAVAFGLLARIAPLAVREGTVIARWPLVGLAGSDPTRGTTLVLAVMIGSTSFDGFSRTSAWQGLVAEARARAADVSPRVLDLLTMALGLAGL
ncbi:MAG: fenitrothion hydrolase, partial [Thermoleophilia bacterium]|nr:hypothetical protein [Gaiellaceae bacterium]MDW8339767.1 fenitrothion hydrolase [Thermoleophilia bacterium]